MDLISIILGVVFPILAGVGVTLTLSPSVPEEFWAARACFVGAGLIGIGLSVYWLTISDRALWLRLSLAAIAGLIFVPSTVGILQWVAFRAKLSAPDVLVPDSLPTPPLPPGLILPPNLQAMGLKGSNYLPPPGALLVFYGSNLAWTTEFPHTILRMGNMPMLVIDREPKSSGIMVRVLRIFDDRGDIIARVEDNGFWANGQTRKSRPSPSILKIFDHNDAEVLNLHMLNKESIMVQGIFRKAGSPPVIIGPNSAKIGRFTLTNSTSAENNVDISVP